MKKPKPKKKRIFNQPVPVAKLIAEMLPHRAGLGSYTKDELSKILDWCVEVFEPGSWVMGGVYPGWISFKHGSDLMTFKLVWTK